MNKIKFFSFLLTILFLSSSCTTEKNTPALDSLSEELQVDTEDINSTIILVDSPEMANTHNNGELLSLRLINQSTETINFDGDFDLNLLVQEKGAWVDGINAFYYPDDRVKLFPAKSDPVGMIVDTSPYIKDIVSAKTVRIIVSGMVDSKNSLVVAYIDVTIFP